MSNTRIGDPDDPFAIGSGSVIAQLKRLRHRSETQFTLPPMWGTSRLRDETTINDASGNVAVGEDSGEVKVETGADGSDYIDLRTAEYAQYRSGLYGDASFGIRLASLPSGNQVVRWGYYDDFAGFGWGVDAESVFTFYREGQSDTIYRPKSSADDTQHTWTLDSLEGDGESGLTLDVLDGAVYHSFFRLYGHGPIIQYVEPKDPSTGRAPEVAVDRRVYPNKINIVDFNRQLRVEIDNDGTADTQAVYIGGRNYELWGDTQVFERRDVPLPVRGYSVDVTDTYEPIVAVRKKDNFPSGTSRGNSVSTSIVDITTRTDGNAEIALTIDADVGNADGDWDTPPRWTAEETALEWIDGTTTPITINDDGLQTAHLMTGGAKNASNAIRERSELPLGKDIVAVLWARAPSGSTEIAASLTVEEQR